MSEETPQTEPELDAEIMPNPFTLFTEDGLVIRQYAVPEDDHAFFKLQNDNYEHIVEFGNKIYETLDEVKEARINPQGVIKLGVSKEGVLIGDACIAGKDDEEAELGIVLAKDATGHGYATSVLKTLTDYSLAHYERVFAEVSPNNVRSIALMRRCGYFEPEPGKVFQREWGEALVFEPRK
jgi:RimJ/RimL family protein N-acetyltransferase